MQYKAIQTAQSIFSLIPVLWVEVTNHATLTAQTISNTRQLVQRISIA